jgi:hypothetical protein
MRNEKNFARLVLAIIEWQFRENSELHTFRALVPLEIDMNSSIEAAAYFKR